MRLTIISNLRHAARNRETVVIGGGEFKAKELAQAADLLEQNAKLLEALKGLVMYPLGTFQVTAAKIAIEEAESILKL